jgi:hypothetical protein
MINCFVNTSGMQRIYLIPNERLIGVCIIGGRVFIVVVGGWGYVVQVGSAQIDVAFLQ